jgi:protein associated with RNAse G/E
MKLKKGKRIQIHGFKHDGSLHRVWTNSFVVDDNESYLVTGNHRTKVIESNGRSWYTKEPALCYFFEQEWFNVIAMFKKDGIHYYCNVSSPYAYDTEAIKYIDYDLDIRIYPNGRIVVLDQKEFIDNAEKMNYSKDIKKIVNHAITELKQRIKDKQPPFDKVSANLNLESFQKILEHQQALKENKNIIRKGKKINE